MSDASAQGGARAHVYNAWQVEDQIRDGLKMNTPSFPTAPQVAIAVGAALREHNRAAADRLITELFGRVLNARSPIPGRVFDRPPSTSDQRYDTLLATGLAYAALSQGLAPAAWMYEAPKLEPEWLWDQDPDPLPEYREYVRRQTPTLFLERGILLRAKDLTIR